MKFFPVMGRNSLLVARVPRAFVESHDMQAQANHGGQTVQRLAERGGLDWTELLAVVTDKPWRAMDPAEASEQVMAHLVEWSREPIRAQLATARAEAFRSVALEIRASIACANRDGDALDQDWCAAAAETMEGYADGDGAPDDERNRRLLAECATAPAAKPTPDAERIYPCDDCGKMRSKDEGGTVFTVCDACWDAHVAKPTPDAKCGACKGSGRLQRVTGDFIYEKKDCPDCGGTGVRR